MHRRMWKQGWRVCLGVGLGWTLAGCGLPIAQEDVFRDLSGPARAAIVALHPLGTIDDVDYDDDTRTYEVEVDYRDGTEYRVIVTRTGIVLRNQRK